jgi:hypothetical protein
MEKKYYYACWLGEWRLSHKQPTAKLAFQDCFGVMPTQEEMRNSIVNLGTTKREAEKQFFALSQRVFIVRR